MADKLRYDVEVNTRDGVKELDRLGQAGKEAGEEIEEGFDGTESAAKQAATALVAAAKEIEAALESDKAAADALALAMGPELSARIDSSGAVAELKKLGLTADQVKADADSLALAIKEVDDINLGSVKGEIDKVDDGIRQIGDTSDQSRSVLANMAGNASQDLGELGGVAGTAGVAIGQLAEYATEGNISLSSLAKVAGPMAGLAAATIVAKNAMSFFQADAKRSAEQLDAMTDALKAGEDPLDAYTDLLKEEGGVFTQQRDQGVKELITDVIGLTESVTDVTPALNAAGVSIEEWNEALRGDRTVREDFVDGLHELVDEGKLTQSEWYGIVTAFGNAAETYDTALANMGESNEFFASSSGAINNALAENVVNLTRTSVWWKRLLNDMVDGSIDTVKATDAFNSLRDELGLDEDQMAALAQTKLDETLRTFADATGEATGAAEDHTEALRDEVEAMEAAAEKAQEAADANRAAVDSYYGLESAHEQLNDARTQYLEDADEYGDTSAEATRSLRDVRDAAIDVADAEVQLARDRARSNRVTYSSVDAIDTENDALLRQASTLQGPERQAILTHIAAVNDIPQDVMTEIETLIDQGKYDEALALLAEVSGRRDLSIVAEVDRAAAAVAKAALDHVAADQTVVVDANIQPALDAVARLRQAIRGAQIAAAAAANVAGLRSVAPAGPAPTPLPAAASTVVTLNLPRGTRPDDAVRAIDNYARRNGSTRARR